MTEIETEAFWRNVAAVMGVPFDQKAYNEMIEQIRAYRERKANPGVALVVPGGLPGAAPVV